MTNKILPYRTSYWFACGNVSNENKLGRGSWEAQVAAALSVTDVDVRASDGLGRMCLSSLTV
jgi:hypothetical protein